MRSTLSGKNAQVIVSTDIVTPNGLTIDHSAEKLYYSDGSLGKIERCEYDGSHRYVSKITLYKVKRQKHRIFINTLKKMEKCTYRLFPFLMGLSFFFCVCFTVKVKMY